MGYVWWRLVTGVGRWVVVMERMRRGEAVEEIWGQNLEAATLSLIVRCSVRPRSVSFTQFVYLEKIRPLGQNRAARPYCALRCDESDVVTVRANQRGGEAAGRRGEAGPKQQQNSNKTAATTKARR